MACLSLQQATAALLMHAPNRQRIASLMALKNMIAVANSAFARAEQRILKEDSEIRAGQFRKSPWSLLCLRKAKPPLRQYGHFASGGSGCSFIFHSPVGLHSGQHFRQK